VPPKCGATPKDAEQDPLFRALLKPGFGRVFFVRELEHPVALRPTSVAVAFIILEARAAAGQHAAVATSQHKCACGQTNSFLTRRGLLFVRGSPRPRMKYAPPATAQIRGGQLQSVCIVQATGQYDSRASPFSPTRPAVLINY